MSDKEFKESLQKDSKTLELVDKQINVALELKKTNEDLLHNTMILEGLGNTINNIAKAEQFEHIKEESKHIINDLTTIKDEDDKIEFLGEKTISLFKSHRQKFKKNASDDEINKIKLITVGKQEIIRDEQRVIDIIENNKHTIKLALDYLNKIVHMDFVIEKRDEAFQAVKRAQIQIRHVYLTAQAIIELEARIKQEEEELEQGINEINMAA